MPCHQRFIATMQGRTATWTATFCTFGDAQFDEAAFEAQLTGDRILTMVCLHWIVKLKTRFPVRGLRRGARDSRQGEGAVLGLDRLDPVTRLLFATLR
jgi:hypothetical protein